MRTNELAGTGYVFRFTLIQYLKAKSTILTMLLLVAAVIASVFIAGYSMGAGEAAAGVINDIAIVNETDIEIGAADIAAWDMSYAGLTETGPGSCDVLVTIYEQDGAYHVRAEGGNVDISELVRLENTVAGALGVLSTGREIYAGEAMHLGEYLAHYDEEDDFAASFTISYVYSRVVSPSGSSAL